MEQVNRLYIGMENPMYDLITKKIRRSHPNSCILWIEEIVNPKLEEQYQERKENITTTRGFCEERLMFHGTKEDFIDVISIEGFDPTLNKTSAYGKGVYFAANASYSFNYMDIGRNDVSYMFLCNVLIGNSCIGSHGKHIDTKLYDSACNNLTKPTIIVTPYHNGSYPRYIIAFHKNAM
jgi:hypothetical protein